MSRINRRRLSESLVLIKEWWGGMEWKWGVVSLPHHSLHSPPPRSPYVNQVFEKGEEVCGFWGRRFLSGVETARDGIGLRGRPGWFGQKAQICLAPREDRETRRGGDRESWKI